MDIRKVLAGIMAVAIVSAPTVLNVADLEVNAEGEYVFSLQGQVGTTALWDGDAPSVVVTGDGDYSLSFDLKEATESTNGSGALMLSTDINAFDYVDSGIPSETGITISVTSVTVDDGSESLEYSFSDGSYTLNDDGSTIRLNLYNTWGGNQCTDLNMDFTAEKRVVVNFTVSGLGSSVDTVQTTDGTETEYTTVTTEETTVTTEATSTTTEGTTEAPPEYTETTTTTPEANVNGVQTTTTKPQDGTTTQATDAPQVQDTPKIELSFNKTSMKKGEEFKVVVKIVNVSGEYDSLSLDLEYDSKSATYVSSDDDDSWDFSSVSNRGVLLKTNSDKKEFTLTFKALKSGDIDVTGYINVKGVAVGNSGEAIQLKKVSNSYAVTSATTTASTKATTTGSTTSKSGGSKGSSGSSGSSGSASAEGTVEQVSNAGGNTGDRGVGVALVASVTAIVSAVFTRKSREE